MLNLTAKPSLPSRAADPRVAELEAAIVKIDADLREARAASTRCERDRVEKKALASAVIISRFQGRRAKEERDAARAAAAEADALCVRLADRLRDLEDDRADAIACRATLQDEIASTLAPQLLAVLAERVKVAEAALGAALAPLEALHAAADHAEAQFANPANGVYDGRRHGLPIEAVALGRALDDVVEQIGRWRRDARTVFQAL